MKKTLLALAVLLCGSVTYGQAATYSARLTWTQSPTSGVQYNVYSPSVAGACGLSAPSGSTCTKLNSSPLSVLTYTDAGLTAGTSKIYTVKAVNSVGIESDPATEATANLAKPGAPGSISVTVVVQVTTP